MKKYYIIIILLSIVLISSPVFTKTEPEDGGNVKLSPGMELKQIGTVNRLVPVDMRVVDKDGLVTTESMGEYVARRFIETENRFKVIENSLSKIKEVIQALQQEIIQLQDLIETLPKAVPQEGEHLQERALE